MMPRSTYFFGIFLALLGAVGFASKGIIIKLAYRLEADALTVLFFRMLLALPFYLLAIFWYYKKQKIVWNKQQKIRLLFLGLLGYYLSSFLDFKGLEYVSASLERIILFVYPTLVLLLMAFYYGRKVSYIQKWAIAISYLGILVALSMDLGQQKDLFRGVFFVFSAAFCFALYLVFSEKLIRDLGSGFYTACIMTVASFGVFTHFFIEKGFQMPQFGADFYVLSVLIALFATVFPSFMVSKSISLIGSANSAIVASAGPVLTILMAYFILDENITWGHILGTCLTLAGVSLLSWQR